MSEHYRIFSNEHLPQGSDEWKKVRLGRISGTKSKYVGAGAKNIDAITTTVDHLQKELAPDYKAPSFNSTAMKHGTEYEPKAREHYARYTLEPRQQVVEVGLVQTIKWDGMVILSPDGLVTDSANAKYLDGPTEDSDMILDTENTVFIGAVEIKCRTVDKWKAFKKSLKISSEAMHQIVHYFVTIPEIDWVDYVEFNPFEVTEEQAVVVRVHRKDKLAQIKRVINRLDEVHKIMYTQTPILNEDGEIITDSTKGEPVTDEPSTTVVEEVTHVPTMIIPVDDISNVNVNTLQMSLSALEIEVMREIGMNSNVDIITSANASKWLNSKKALRKLQIKVNKDRLASRKPVADFLKSFDTVYKDLESKLEAPIENITVALDTYEESMREERERAEKEAREATQALVDERYVQLVGITLPMELECINLAEITEAMFQQYLTMYTKRASKYTIAPTQLDTSPEHVAYMESINPTDEPVAELLTEIEGDITGSVMSADHGRDLIPSTRYPKAIVSIAGKLTPEDYNMYCGVYYTIIQCGLPVTPEGDASNGLYGDITKFIAELKIKLGIE